MNNEKMNQIIDEVYENYRAKSKLSQIPTDLTKGEFVKLCKNDTTFSVYWGLKIEEQTILEQVDQNNPVLKGSTALYPRKLITVTYNDIKTEIYE